MVAGMRLNQLNVTNVWAVPSSDWFRREYAIAARTQAAKKTPIGIWTVAGWSTRELSM
jgi:hypothetical protein